MAVSGERIVQLGRSHIGVPYVFGSLAAKDNAEWRGPWDCAEFASWLVFQAAGVLYGCESDSGDPGSADAFTGYWARDAESRDVKISVAQATRTPGAAVLRSPQPGAVGHIVISDGRGGTVEAHSAKAGVIASTISQRRWDMGILVPGIEYSEGDAGPEIEEPRVVIYRLTEPHMVGPTVREIQQKLKEQGVHAWRHRRRLRPEHPCGGGVLPGDPRAADRRGGRPGHSSRPWSEASRGVTLTPGSAVAESFLFPPSCRHSIQAVITAPSALHESPCASAVARTRDYRCCRDSTCRDRAG